MAAGVAYYPELEGKPLILIEEPALAEMDPTAQGCPVYVHHVDKVDMANLENEMAGVWIRSFFNEADGFHWAEFTVQSDEAHDAYRKGFVLSNSYFPLNENGPGEYHGMPYKNAVVQGKYEHLAMTPRPRYQESAEIGLLTPEEFKAYNEKKLTERAALKNSKGDPKMAFTLFGKKKLENGADLEGAIIELPKTKKQVELLKLVNDADEKAEKESKGEYAADLSHKVKLHDGKMCNVGELLEMHKKNSEDMESMRKENEEMKAKMPKDEDSVGMSNEDDEEMKKKNAEIEEAEKKQNELQEKLTNALNEQVSLYTSKGLEVPASILAKLKNGKEHFEALKNAADKGVAQEALKLKNSQTEGAPEVRTLSDRVAEGALKY